ncbi:MAG: asparaginase [Haloplasmataceae bacterium]|nr:asparaginase [Haloplasmataceae bacterium]
MKNMKVAIIFTGGTISMKIDEKMHAAVPSLNGSEVMTFLPNIEEITDIIVDNYISVPSPFITPDIMMDLSIKIKDYVNREDITGVIITHGTDTLEETAYFLDLHILTPKPIIVVGAMRSVSELGYDGPSNLAAAIRTAISVDARNKGVMVVMNGDINAANEVQKTHTMSLDTFKSPEFGPLGIVDNDEVFFYRNSTHVSTYIPTTQIEHKVYLLKVVAGLDGELIDFFIEKEAVGIVIEALGRGNVPPMMVDSIKRAMDLGIKIVLVSRCPNGRVSDSYGYDGGSKKLRDLGVIFGRNLSGQKARIKLMLALGFNNNYEYIKEIFEKV